DARRFAVHGGTLPAAGAAVLGIGAEVGLAAVVLVGVAALPRVVALLDLAGPADARGVRVRQHADVAAGAAVALGGEQVGLALLLEVAVALDRAADAGEHALVRLVVARGAQTVARVLARCAHATAVARRAAAVARPLVAVQDVFVAARRRAVAVRA